MEKKEQIKRNIAHFGAIGFNYSMAGAIVTITLLLSIFLSWVFVGAMAILVFAYYAILSIITVLSLFTLLALDKFRALYRAMTFDHVSKVSDWLAQWTPKIMDIVPIMAIASALLCVISIVCLLFDRTWEKSRSRLITLGVMAIVLVILAILLFAGVIVIAKGAK